jgi:Fe2+ or Zn2+ uptake regulation protein
MTQQEFKKTGLRQTSAREKLVELFSEKRTWSAKQIQACFNDVDRATIFRNLKTLQKKNIITPIHAHAGETLFELAGRSHHAHQICSKCQTAICVPCPIKSKTEHNLEFFNLCQLCAK